MHHPAHPVALGCTLIAFAVSGVNSIRGGMYPSVTRTPSVALALPW